MIDPNNHKCISKLSNFESRKSCDFFIALRKPTQSCTQNSISKFIAYNTLYTRFHVLTSNFDRTKINKIFHDTLKVPEYKGFVME